MTKAEAANAKTEGAFRWTVRLYEQARWKRAVVFGVATLAGVFGATIFHNALFGLLGFVMILGATAEFWMGANYSIDDAGVKSRIGLSVTAMTWDNVKRVEFAATTAKLSPLVADSIASPFRGVLLRFALSDRSAVLAEIERRWEGDVRFLEG